MERIAHDKAFSILGKLVFRIGIVGFIVSAALALACDVQDWLAYVAIPSGVLLIVGFATWNFFRE